MIKPKLKYKRFTVKIGPGDNDNLIVEEIMNRFNEWEKLNNYPEITSINIISIGLGRRIGLDVFYREPPERSEK